MSAYPYIDTARPEMLAFIPDAARRVLDVGCGYGGFGATLKASRPSLIVWGIEPFAEAATLARDRLDRLIVGTYPGDLPSSELFDCIVFNDVLEHDPDPWATLRQTQSHLSPGGCVVASIPNVRHWSVVWSLLRAGTWTYRDAGILDRTHLRFFTRSSIIDLFADTGYRVARIQPITSGVRGRMAGLVARLGRRTEDFRTIQYGVQAEVRVADRVWGRLADRNRRLGRHTLRSRDCGSIAGFTRRRPMVSTEWAPSGRLARLAWQLRHGAVRIRLAMFVGEGSIDPSPRIGIEGAV